ncbi:5-dehydro-2-deoxygluconokinase [Usitatibacter rugosus]|uniref:5-dehydro-2-deoxygluconokinase n=1 Tax=Usitatibacter rugosus TaxID=2732067 RepID=A0A6M4GSW9_9PROT|nr:5-dehydro-2-deoxygluconokinase [Usitatibacter rugosus]QJR10145.1 5-dehydro-2-deoxygluconokinase [Usitatibacter rugosus]
MSGTAREFDLACLGRAAVDLYGEQIGTSLEGLSTFARYVGGSPANTAVGTARLGLRPAMLTRVGDEQNGRFVRAALEREGVDVSQVATDPKRLTALVFLAIRDRDDFPHLFYRDNCADMGLVEADIDPAFIRRCGAVLISGTHLSTPSTHAAVERTVHAARESGGRVILDIDYRPVLWGIVGHAGGAERAAASAAATERITGLLPACTLVVGTEEEFCVAGGSGDVLTALRNVRSHTQALLVLKRGPHGCVCFEGAIPQAVEQGLVVPGFRIEVFNVLGAGDAFMAGFLRGWLRDEPLETCCRYANACGAIVVSRHGCAPAMPTEIELHHFLTKGSSTPRLRDDADLEHVHRASVRRPLHTPLYILAFDHRSQLETIAGTDGAPGDRIAAFKALVCDAFLRCASRHPGGGVIVDDRYCEAILPRLTAAGHWVARPVELPGSIPLAFEAGGSLGLQLRTWPAEHVVKCLVFYHPDDPQELCDLQMEQMRVAARACAETGRELLLEIIPPTRVPASKHPVARALEAIYAAGIRPDWWKLPPSVDGADWKAVDKLISKNDPLCRGILVLGMEASAQHLGESFAAAVKSPWVRGFAVGRSIFAPAAEHWFAGRWNDEQVIEDVAHRYEDIIASWEAAAAAVARAPAGKEKIA